MFCFFYSSFFGGKMTIIQAIVVGLIQGFTEFLPISSSGHMLLAGKIMDVSVSLGFELILHVATLLAVVIIMRKDILTLLRRPFQKEVRLLAVASAATVVIVLVFRDFFESTFGGELLPYCFILTAILLLVSGFIKNPLKKEIGYLDALIIGTVQGMAALPGLSRSGSTISTSVLLGNDKKSSARFSFLLSIPIIIGSAIVELAGGGLGHVEILPLLFGFAAAFVSGLFALKFMLEKLFKSFDYFALYLLALSILLILNDLLLGWF
jgi:undecaprenyl-diphosphatase